jgi:hypothetical protein
MILKKAAVSLRFIASYFGKKLGAAMCYFFLRLPWARLQRLVSHEHKSIFLLSSSQEPSSLISSINVLFLEYYH